MVTTHCCRYVATRWYRAPEIMLNWMHYNQTGNIKLQPNWSNMHSRVIVITLASNDICLAYLFLALFLMLTKSWKLQIILHYKNILCDVYIHCDILFFCILHLFSILQRIIVWLTTTNNTSTAKFCFPIIMPSPGFSWFMVGWLHHGRDAHWQDSLPRHWSWV